MVAGLAVVVLSLSFMKDGKKKYRIGVRTGSEIMKKVAGMTNNLNTNALSAIRIGILITNRATRADRAPRMMELSLLPLPPLVISVMIPAMGMGMHSTGTPP
uniref:Uncharacterized protein n=1 Tax=Cacopsylla melanoneura TaxID=428564 RepID=A0A8D9ATC6_9HEMI